ncbi:alpha/beta hydrolase [Kordia sp. YSTF-M3]|uniref:Alpha/beta hydrolase n=1 Tax=Kordia aestuariivivens TaxID=2759037 RepID=A0ABR7Q8W9_9FLAO|nr:alpha/beta hydrolase [Kordia aestuariivivens]MBC8755004.1 alpha/beta hydrolase [Kordia aestuariivivens]
MEFLHKNENQTNNIIIFIHGFVGGETTWVKNGKEKSLIDMILEDRNIDIGYDISLFTYYTKLSDFITRKGFSLFRKQRIVNNSIDEIAKLLSSEVKYFCKEYDNIILIGHSMGGLIAKKFILDDLQETPNSKVQLYFSLASPHSGANLAILGKLILKNPQISGMTPLSDNIRKINDEWIRSKNLPKRLYFQGLSDNIVPKNSSIALDRDKQNVIYSNDDHFSIIIPKEDNLVVLEALKRELKDFLIKSHTKTNKFVDEEIKRFRRKLLTSKNISDFEKLLFDVKLFKEKYPETYEIERIITDIKKSIKYENARILINNNSSKERGRRKRKVGEIFVEEKSGNGCGCSILLIIAFLILLIIYLRR